MNYRGAGNRGFLFRYSGKGTRPPHRVILLDLLFRDTQGHRVDLIENIQDGKAVGHPLLDVLEDGRRDEKDIHGG